jgi:ABC-2 family transporter
MIWVAWRQQRLLTLISLGLVAVVAIGMAALWIDVSSVLPADSNVLSKQYSDAINYSGMLMLALPLLLGMFAGAPVFARELEQGTHVFGLTQSIGRTRWWATKLLVAGLPVIIAMTLLGLLNAKALGPLSVVMTSRMQLPMFESQGVVVGAYTALAFAIGTTAGLLVRSTLAAMAITIGGYLAMLIVIPNAARPHYATPVYSPTGTVPGPGVWRTEIGYLDVRGNAVDFSGGDCGLKSLQECMAEQGVVGQFVRYHPVDRFWSFQFIEAGIFVGVAAVLLGLGAWAVRRIH